MDRFMKQVSPEPNTGCWLWLGSLKSTYGQFSIKAKSVLAHRIAYELFRGPIPAGMQIDHLCRVRTCVNPDHLEVVTLQENLRRGLGTAAAIEASRKVKAAITHCPYDHEYTPENTRMENGCRRCRQCERVANLARYHRNKSNPAA